MSLPFFFVISFYDPCHKLLAHGCLPLMPMYFKRYISLFLIGLLTILCIKDWVTVVQFKANRSFVARYMCVNRNNPDLKCNGKCFLMKKLKQSQNASKYPPTKEELKQVYYTLVEPVMLRGIDKKEISQTEIQYAVSKQPSTFLLLFSPPPELTV